MNRVYKPRRQSKRWLDGDCPAGVLAIYDNRGQSADRYTVFYAEPVTGETFAEMWLGYRAMSESPFHPCGVGLYGEMPAHAASIYRYHNRHRAAKWSSLPADVRRCVLQDLEAHLWAATPAPHYLDVAAGPLYLRRIRLNSGGYDAGGAYWGLGTALWYVEDQRGNSHFFRCPSREGAKVVIHNEWPGARFYR